MQSQIALKSDIVKDQGRAIDKLLDENTKLAARVAELEGLLFGYGVIDRYGNVRHTAMERVKIISEMLDQMEATE